MKHASHTCAIRPNARILAFWRLLIFQILRAIIICKYNSAGAYPHLCTCKGRLRSAKQKLDISIRLTKRDDAPMHRTTQSRNITVQNVSPRTERDFAGGGGAEWRGNVTHIHMRGCHVSLSKRHC